MLLNLCPLFQSNFRLTFKRVQEAWTKPPQLTALTKRHCAQLILDIRRIWANLGLYFRAQITTSSILENKMCVCGHYCQIILMIDASKM